MNDKDKKENGLLTGGTNQKMSGFNDKRKTVLPSNLNPEKPAIVSRSEGNDLSIRPSSVFLRQRVCWFDVIINAWPSGENQSDGQEDFGT